MAVAFATNKFGGIASVPGSPSPEIAAGRPGAGQSAPIEGEEAPQANENPTREAAAGPYATLANARSYLCSADPAQVSQ
jgi:hypothetical protein